MRKNPLVRLTVEIEYRAPFLVCAREESFDGWHRMPDEEDVEQDVRDAVENAFIDARFRVTRLVIDGKDRGQGVWEAVGTYDRWPEKAAK